MTDSLTTITQEKFDQAEAMVIGLLRDAMPLLDLRRGTVLRDLLVRPAAAFYALEADRLTKAQATRSLALMAESPDLATADDVNAVLSNFAMTRRAGMKAQGAARIVVAYDRAYTVDAGTVLRTLDGLEFACDITYTAKSSPDPLDRAQLKLWPAADGESYYFDLPLVAADVGVSYQLRAGTALNFRATFDGFVAATALGDFVGAADAETLEALMARLPYAISHRSLESRASIDAILRSPEHGNFDDVLQDVGVQGYGDDAQLRDKHNAMGVAMGGKVDVYVRTFNQPVYVTLEKVGTLIAPNTYRIDISADDAPGFYAVRAVTDAESSVSPALEFGQLPAVGSYDVTDVRAYASLQQTKHDVDPANGIVETAYTSLQRATLIVNEVAASENSKRFKVQLYVAPRLAEIQAYVDSHQVANVKADYLVRCPPICLVGLRVRVVRMPGAAALDVDAMKARIADYVNGRSFVAQLTVSEIVAILHQFEIRRVDMSSDPNSGFQMVGVVRDAAGGVHRLSGPNLDLRLVRNPQNLLTPETAVFGVDRNDIYITVTDE